MYDRALCARCVAAPHHARSRRRQGNAVSNIRTCRATRPNDGSSLLVLVCWLRHVLRLLVSSPFPRNGAEWIHLPLKILLSSFPPAAAGTAATKQTVDTGPATGPYSHQVYHGR